VVKRFVAVPGNSVAAFDDNERALALYRALPDPDDAVLRIEPWCSSGGPPPDGLRISGRIRLGDRVAGFHEVVTMTQLRSGTAGLRDAIVARVEHLLDESRALLA
jgi:hypothetical protein